MENESILDDIVLEYTKKIKARNQNKFINWVIILQIPNVFFPELFIHPFVNLQIIIICYFFIHLVICKFFYDIFLNDTNFT